MAKRTDINQIPPDFKHKLNGLEFLLCSDKRIRINGKRQVMVSVVKKSVYAVRLPSIKNKYPLFSGHFFNRVVVTGTEAKAIKKVGIYSNEKGTYHIEHIQAETIKHQNTALS